MFMKKKYGYNFEVLQVDLTTGALSAKKVSDMNFYSYRLMVRKDEFNIIVCCCRLFLQFTVDMFNEIESERLLLVKLNQKKFREYNYIHLRDSMNNDANLADVNQLVILPSTFSRSLRHKYVQNAMTYVRNYGRPDLIITFTCNPSCPEIQPELMEGQKQNLTHMI